MNFSEALELIKQRKKLARTGWNGKGIFIYLVDGSEFEVNRASLNKIYPEGTKIKYRPHLDLRAPDGTCGVWTPSNSDLLMEDWEIIE